MGCIMQDRHTELHYGCPVASSRRRGTSSTEGGAQSNGGGGGGKAPDKQPYADHGARADVEVNDDDINDAEAATAAGLNPLPSAADSGGASAGTGNGKADDNVAPPHHTIDDFLQADAPSVHHSLSSFRQEKGGRKWSRDHIRTDAKVSTLPLRSIRAQWTLHGLSMAETGAPNSPGAISLVERVGKCLERYPWSYKGLKKTPDCSSTFEYYSPKH
jgi:hypothetical protein